MVLDGAAAERLVVSARSGGGPDDRDGITLFLLDPHARGVTVARQQLVDHRVAAVVRLDDVEVAADAQLGATDRGAEVLDATIDRALVGLCADMLGGMVRAFEMTLAYLKDRKQFGVTIGSFQALKHRAARMFIEIELGRSAVMAAARSTARRTRARLLPVQGRPGGQRGGADARRRRHDRRARRRLLPEARAGRGDPARRRAYHRDRFARLQAY
jgi:alkylation response protein AidB-like acyl-CoA dehydrogenase